MPRTVVKPALVVALTVGCVLAAAVWAPSASFGRAPGCSASNLALESVRTLGSAGARDWDLALRNTGPQTCGLTGYPGVTLLDAGARPMNVTITRARRSVRRVVLRAWQRAFFTLHYESNGPCPAGIFPKGLQVFPPNGTRRLRIYHPLGVCKGDRPAVTPVRARLGGL